MSAYHEWFLSDTDKITVQKPLETVQKSNNSFFTLPIAPVDESIGLEFTPDFNSLAQDDAPPTPLTPMRIRSNKPALPVEQWAEGLSQFDSLATKCRLGADFFCTVGMDANGYHVRADPVYYDIIPT